METDRAAEDAVLAANLAFYAAFNAMDIGAMERVWLDSDDVTCIHPGWNVLRGRDLVIESWRGILSNPAQPKIMIGGENVSFAGTVAIVTCRELVAGSPLAAANVFVQEAGEWRMLHHQSGPVSMP
jgi:ketosteroid isomerase-like protein